MNPKVILFAVVLFTAYVTWMGWMTLAVLEIKTAVAVHQAAHDTAVADNRAWGE